MTGNDSKQIMFRSSDFKMKLNFVLGKYISNILLMLKQIFEIKEEARMCIYFVFSEILGKRTKAVQRRWWLLISKSYKK